MSSIWAKLRKLVKRKQYFITYEEASQELGCTKQDVGNLVNWGVLTSFIDINAVPMIRAAELECLKDGKWRNYKPPVSDIGAVLCQRPLPPIRLSYH